MPMSSCDHEEADTLMCIHVQDSLEKSAIVILVWTVDTDVIVKYSSNSNLYFQE